MGDLVALRCLTKSAIPSGVVVGDLLDLRLGHRNLGRSHLVGRQRVAVVVHRTDAGALVAQHDGQPLVQERHLLQAATDGLVGVRGGLEDRTVRPVRHRRAGLVGLLALGQRRGRLLVDVGLGPAEPVPLDVDLQPGRERVDDRDTDAVQSTGHRIGVAVELSAGMQHGEDDLDGRLLLLGVHADGHSSAVVGHPDRAVGEQGHLDPVAVAGQGLVDGVVDDLPHQVVQSPLAGRTDVHTRTFANSFQALEDLNRICSVTGRRLARHSVLPLRYCDAIAAAEWL